MGRLNFQNIAGSLVKPANRFLILPASSLLVVAEDLLPLNLRIINPDKTAARLYQRIPGQTLIDHIHFVAALDGGKLGAFDQFADIVDPGVAGGVDFHNVEDGAVADAPADFALTTGLWIRDGMGEAVEGFG
jgi:hypothetical protein